MHGAVSERECRLSLAERRQRRVMRDPPEADDGPHGRQRPDAGGQIGSTGVDLGGRRLVFGRHATHRVGHHAVDELQPIVRARREPALGKAEFVEGCVEQIARKIAGERASGAIGTLEAGGEPNDQQPRRRRAERSDRRIMPTGFAGPLAHQECVQTGAQGCSLRAPRASRPQPGKPRGLAAPRMDQIPRGHATGGRTIRAGTANPNK